MIWWVSDAMPEVIDYSNKKRDFLPFQQFVMQTFFPLQILKLHFCFKILEVNQFLEKILLPRVKQDIKTLQ